MGTIQGGSIFFTVHNSRKSFILYPMRLFRLFLLLFPVLLQAQLGGRYAFDALRLTPNARVNSLGGVLISTSDQDPFLALQNPALSQDKMHSRLGLNWSNALADIQYGQLAYSHRVKAVGNLHGGVQFINYGDFSKRDVLGNSTGVFEASAYKFTAGASRAFDEWRFGASFNFYTAQLDWLRYQAFTMDMGGSWQDTSRFTSFGFVLKNFGSQVGRFQEGDARAALPFEIQAGVSQRLEHLPLRFSLTGIHLNRFMGLIYQDPNPVPEYDLSGQLIPVRKRTADKIARHFVLGAELNVSKQVYLRAGYNHQRRQELKTLNQGGIAGFSYGAGVKISWFSFDYGFARFHASSNLHQFSLTMNLSSPIKKMRI